MNQTSTKNGVCESCDGSGIIISMSIVGKIFAYACPDCKKSKEIDSAEKDCINSPEPKCFSFSKALKKLKQGKKVTRKDWNDKYDHYLVWLYDEKLGYSVFKKFKIINEISWTSWGAYHDDLLAYDWYEVE